MGTRSLTHVLDDVWEPEQTPKTLVTIYRQMDGYPSGMGADLAGFLRGRRIVNGISFDDPDPTSNGMNELAAQLVTALKTDSPSGGIYLYPPDSVDCGEEYVYTISRIGTRNGTGGINLRIEDVSGGYGDKPVTRTVLFDGPVEDFDAEKVEAAQNAMWEAAAD